MEHKNFLLAFLGRNLDAIWSIFYAAGKEIYWAELKIFSMAQQQKSVLVVILIIIIVIIVLLVLRSREKSSPRTRRSSRSNNRRELSSESDQYRSPRCGHRRRRSRSSSSSSSSSSRSSSSSSSSSSDIWEQIPKPKPVPCNAVCNGKLNPAFANQGRLSMSLLGDLYLALDVAVASPGVNVILAPGYVGRINDVGSPLTLGFGTAGLVDLSALVSPNFDPIKIAVQPDLKILVGGNNTNGGIIIVRLNSDGTLDTSFNGTGIYQYPDGYYLDDIIVTKTGKIVACGSQSMASYYGLILNLNANGTLNTGFNLSGIYYYIASPNNAEFNALTEQKDGKLVLVGHSDSKGLVLRLNADGSPDNTFGTGGFVLSQIGTDNTYYLGVVVQDNGRIIAVGDNGLNNSAIISAYSSTGVLDSGFGTSGSVLVDYPGGSSGFQDVISFCDNSIVVTGYGFEQTLVFKTAKYDSKGVLVSTFGTAGLISVSGPTVTGNTVVKLANGSLLYAAYRETISVSCV